MVNEKQQNCKCGFKLKRLYSRDTSGYTSQDLFVCDKCGKVYEQTIREKQLKEMSQEDSRVILKRKGN